MTHQPTIILSALLAAVVTTAVTGVAAHQGEPEGPREARRGRGEAQRDRDWSSLIAPAGADQRVLRLDGLGSRIGVMVRDVEPGDGAGAAVDAVDNDGPAAKAGVKAGDVVVDFDGERVRSARQLTRLVQETPPGRAVKMTVTRGGIRTTLEVTPASDASARDLEFGPEIRAEIERGLRSWRELPHPPGAMLDVPFDAGFGRGRGRLGVEVQTLSDQLGEYFGVKGGGVLVSAVRPGSPAQKAGVKAGDVITAVNGTAVRDARELAEEVGRAATATDVTLGITRDRKATTLTTTIEPAPGRPGRRVRPA